MTSVDHFKKGGPQHFTFLNGDQYHEEYAADVARKKIFRHGWGTYITANCCIYQGKWNYDKLDGIARIKYAAKQTFGGHLDSQGDYEEGTLEFEDGCKLQGKLDDNLNFVFSDRNDNAWKVDKTEGELIVTNTSTQ